MLEKSTLIMHIALEITIPVFIKVILKVYKELTNFIL